MFTKGFISNIERDNVFVWFGDTAWNAGAPAPSDYRVYQWSVPTGTKMIHIVGCGGGGAGGSGANTVTSSASGGGGGGGGGAITSVFYPAELIPSNLFIVPGFGGLSNNSAVVGATGGASTVLISPPGISSAISQLMIAVGGNGGGFGTTANGASGTGGAAASVANTSVTLMNLGGLCGFSSIAGGSGGISAIPSKTGLNSTWTMGGAAGGTVNASNNPFNGGTITIDTLGSINLNQTISQSQDGFFTTSPTWITTGGGGGNGNSAGGGANGGNGGIGSGGGGGGGGRSSGARSFGGSGGPGFIIITCW
jgi:hypothetical protein